MAEDATQAPEGTQDTPDESAPPSEDTREATPPSSEDTGEEPQDETGTWEERYKNLQADHSRKSQALKEAEQAQVVLQALQSDDPQEAAWAAEILGLELQPENDEGETPEGEEEQYHDPRVDQLLAEREAEQHDRFLDQLESDIDQTISELDKKHGLNLDDREKDLIFARALSLPPTEEGGPPVEQAVDEYRQLLDSRITKYRESKRDAPSPPTPGSSGSDAPDLSDRKSRLALANQVAQKALMREQ